MFGNIGYSELFIIATLAILVIGPKELPAFLRVAGRYFGKIKGFADDFRSQIDDVVNDTQIKDIKDNILKEVEDVKKELPTEKDIGLDFSELDEPAKTSGKDKSKVEAHIDDEDENLDWDEPDEVIETSADGKVTHHSKKTSEPDKAHDDKAHDLAAAESSETVSGSENKAPEATGDGVKPETQNAKSQNNGAGNNASIKSAPSQKNGSEDHDYDDDDGALLDEEEYSGSALTSHDVLEEGRQKFQEAVAAEQAEEKQAALLKKQEVERAKSLKREAETTESNSPQN